MATPAAVNPSGKSVPGVLLEDIMKMLGFV